jgi:hypothetical protein
LAHQELPLKVIIHKPSGHIIQHSYLCVLIHVHTTGFAFESPPDLVPGLKTPLLLISLILSHWKTS